MGVLYKRLLFAVVPVAAAVLLLSSTLAGSFAWFHAEGEDSSDPKTNYGTMGEVVISSFSPENGVFDFKDAGSTSGSGTIDIENGSNIPVACRIQLTLTYYNDGGEQIDLGMQDLQIGVDADSAQKGWYAFKDPNSGIWYLACGSAAGYAEIGVTRDPKDKIVGDEILPVTFTVDGKNADYNLEVTAVPGLMQYSQSDDWTIQ